MLVLREITESNHRRHRGHRKNWKLSLTADTLNRGEDKPKEARAVGMIGKANLFLTSIKKAIVRSCGYCAKL